MLAGFVSKMNQNFFYIIQMVLAVFLVLLVLLQTKGTGLGSTFGGNLAFYRSRRGFEKILFYTTIVAASFFLLTSILRLLL